MLISSKTTMKIKINDYNDYSIRYDGKCHYYTVITEQRYTARWSGKYDVTEYSNFRNEVPSCKSCYSPEEFREHFETAMSDPNLGIELLDDNNNVIFTIKSREMRPMQIPVEDIKAKNCRLSLKGRQIGETEDGGYYVILPRNSGSGTEAFYYPPKDPDGLRAAIIMYAGAIETYIIKNLEAIFQKGAEKHGHDT